MREKVLTVLLVISLCANGYLIFFHHEALDRRVQGIVTPVLYPVSGSVNNSSSDWTTDSWTLNDTANGTLDAIGEGAVLESPTSEGVPEGTAEVTPEETAEVTPEEIVEVTQEPTPSPDVLNNYTNPKYKFSLQYPSTWSISEKAAGRVVLTLTGPVERECPRGSSQCYEYLSTMTIEVDQNPGTPNAEDYFTMAVAALQSKYSITSTSKSAPCILSGSRAYQIEFFTRDARGNPERNYMQYYGLFDGKAFIISYTGPYSTWDNVYSHNKGDAQRIIDSIVIERTYLEV